MTLLLPLLLACSGAPETTAPSPVGPPRRLTFAAFAAAKDAYGDGVLPAFAAHWQQRSGETVVFEQSYQASGAQARAVREGLEADVVSFSLEPDLRVLVEAGLATHDWTAGPTKGMASTSVVVFAVRPGNPKQIHDWSDLARADVEVLTPNVRTSGGAMWNVLALWGAAGRHGGDGSALLSGVLRRVFVMDKSGRESLITFENGVGDAAITYEHEVITARRKGVPIEAVLPPSTLLIENPIAVVDTYADRHGNGDIARAFVEFVLGEHGQRILTETGLRSPLPERTPSTFEAPADLFTIRDLGGWATLSATVFGADGVYDQALVASQEPNR